MDFVVPRSGTHVSGSKFAAGLPPPPAPFCELGADFLDILINTIRREHHLAEFVLIRIGRQCFVLSGFESECNMVKCSAHRVANLARARSALGAADGRTRRTQTHSSACGDAAPAAAAAHGEGCGVACLDLIFSQRMNCGKSTS